MTRTGRSSLRTQEQPSHPDRPVTLTRPSCKTYWLPARYGDQTDRSVRGGDSTPTSLIPDTLLPRPLTRSRVIPCGHGDCFGRVRVSAESDGSVIAVPRSVERGSVSQALSVEYRECGVAWRGRIPARDVPIPRERTHRGHPSNVGDMLTTCLHPVMGNLTHSRRVMALQVSFSGQARRVALAEA